MKIYFLHDGQNEIGPFDKKELSGRKITFDTPYWYEGLDDWKRASEIEELNDIFKMLPPPFKKKSNSENQEAVKNKFKSLNFIIICFTLLICFILFFLYRNSEDKIIQMEKENNDKVESINSIKENSIKKLQLEKQKQLEDNLNEKYKIFRNNWTKYISYALGNNTSQLFGGISDLNITVSNSTDFILDEVIVSVDYILANGGIYKTENVTFNNIPANNQSKIKAPVSDRGISARAKFISIKSTSFNFCYNLYNSGNSDTNDKFKCN